LKVMIKGSLEVFPSVGGGGFQDKQPPVRKPGVGWGISVASFV
jgi:hypothetical protein